MGTFTVGKSVIGKAPRRRGGPIYRLANGLVEGIAGRAHGADHVRPAAAVQRLAEPADMDVDRPELDLGVASPYGVEQLLARKHAARPLHQEPQQAELGRPEMNRLAVARDLVRRQI